MLNEVARASLVLALDEEGNLTVVKNTRGSRMRADGLRQLAMQMTQEDRAQLIQHWVSAGEISLRPSRDLNVRALVGN